MKWPLMTADELHAFGIETVLPYLKKEGVTVQSVSTDRKTNPQIIGERWGTTAFIAVRTACYPDKGALTPEEHMQLLAWADQHGATAFFASVGVACVAYPDRSPVTCEADMQLPIQNGGFAVAYEGLLVLAVSDRVQVWNES
jgi:hypothetical protein